MAAAQQATGRQRAQVRLRSERPSAQGVHRSARPWGGLLVQEHQAAAAEVSPPASASAWQSSFWQKRLVIVNQPVGRRIMRGNGLPALQLRQDRLCQLLAQLHSPLIERVDVPDDALREDLVLVEGDE